MLRLDDPAVQALLSLALAEDLPKGDVTSEACISPETKARAHFVTREACVVAGLPLAARVFALLDPQVRFVAEVQEGAHVEAKTSLAYVEGPARAILSSERTALNFLQRLCAIATQASRFVAAIAHTSCQVVDTRKTTPGWRSLEKYAAQVGGARNHRADLSSGVLIKDNHIAAVGSIREAVLRARKTASHLLKIEVEVEDLAGLREAVEAGADIVLLDNMSPALVAEAVALNKTLSPHGKRALLEASGGINLSTIAAYAEAGVDLISSGAITHSARAIDIGLDIGLS
jgi:nicotinate-nucleotide pyrophosphorylase (carboxylating)